MSTHTAIATTAIGLVESIQVPTAKPAEGQLTIKVEYASLMPFDTYTTDLGFFVYGYPLVLGFNAAGIVTEVSPGLELFKVDDRVAAMAFQESRATQEFTTVHYSVCSKIPDALSLEEAATIPDNFVTAFFILFNKVNIGLPVPSSFPSTDAPASADKPILIYGAGSTAAQYCIQLLHLAGYKRVFATASQKHHAYLKSLGATDVFDYNSPTIVEDVAEAVGGDGKIDTVVDCITAESTISIISKLINPITGKVAILLPFKDGDALSGSDMKLSTEIPEAKNPLPKGVTVVPVSTFLYQEDEYLKLNLLPKILPDVLKKGLIKPNRFRLLAQGSLKDRVVHGLDLLRSNKISGEKLIVKIGA